MERNGFAEAAGVVRARAGGTVQLEEQLETPHARLTIIAPPRPWTAFDAAELWTYRELLFFLVWRDVKVRYKQAAFGVAWALLQPLSTMGVFSVFFGVLARVPSDGLPYPLFSLAAIVPWTFFAAGLSQASNSVVASQHLITKVYFPRLVIPAGSVLAGMLDFVIALLLLVGLTLWFGIMPTTRVLWVVPLTLLALVSSLGVGLWLSALNVSYRDVRYVVAAIAQLWFFVTPVTYPSTLLPEAWRPWYALNPMAGVVEGFRWALLGSDTQPGSMIVVSSITALLTLATGALYFRRMEQSFADVV
jgi:lipopolysaccharide transport system permease protein